MHPAIADLRPMPRSDAVFERVARRLAEESATPLDLEARLRAFFPLAVVRERSLSHEPRVLYIYRDGHYVQDRAEPWWRTEAVATASIDVRTGRIGIEGREPVLGIAPERARGPPRGHVLRRPRGARGRHYEVADLTFATILELGDVTSEALLRRSDGTAVPFEFHAERVGDRIEIALPAAARLAAPPFAGQPEPGLARRAHHAR